MKISSLATVFLLGSLTVACDSGSDSAQDEGSECSGTKCDSADDEEEDADSLEQSCDNYANAVRAGNTAVSDGRLGFNPCGGNPSSSCVEQQRQACLDAPTTCEDRAGEAVECSVESRGRSFTDGAIRWQCADVSTVGKSQRGQEYCEYFALVQLPDEDSPREVGRLLASGGVTPHEIELDEKLEEVLDDEDESVFGQCVFTSWHVDVDEPLTRCENDPAACERFPLSDDTEVASWVPEDGLDFELSESNLRMTVGFNSNFAAMDLVDRCLRPSDAVAAELPSNFIDNEFIKGCMRAFELFQTHWRRSDSAICASTVRFNECGCGLDVDGDGGIDISMDEEMVEQTSQGTRRLKTAARLLVPRPGDDDAFLRGFVLGTWSNPSGLPDGCRYIDLGESDQYNSGQGEHGRNVVACDITAAGIQEAGFTLDSAMQDMKSYCQATYAQDVVVHIPLQGEHVPEANIVCNPPEGAPNCEGLPWVVGAEQGEHRDALCE